MGCVAHAGYLAVSPNGLFTATVTDQAPTVLTITGPDGNVTYNAPGSFTPLDSWHSIGLLINDYGEAVGVTDGGTSDPAVYDGLYFSTGSAFVGSAPLPLPAYLAGYFNAYPELVSLDASGLATVSVSGFHNVAFQRTDYFQLPDEAQSSNLLSDPVASPDPSSGSLFLIGMALLMCNRRA
jgi:hypothetical protein